MKKKGVSPVIATVLLISMVVVLAMIVILWFTSLTQEAITKFDNQNIEIVCREVKFDASYSGGVLTIVNTGSVPIKELKMKAESAGGYDTTSIDLGSGLSPGRTLSKEIDTDEADTITIIPVLLGQSEKGLSTYMCKEGETGYELAI